MNRTIKALLGVGALGGAALAGMFGYALHQGPRMKEQPYLRTYQGQMALPPAGSVAVGMPPFPAAGATAQSSRGKGEGAAARGRAYYGYYCLSCHGKDGRGHGPVGESYFPVPSDLTTVRLSPAALHGAMLTGIGHSPVLERVVPSAYRWDLVAYLQTLSGGSGGTGNGR